MAGKTLHLFLGWFPSNGYLRGKICSFLDYETGKSTLERSRFRYKYKNRQFIY